MSYAHTDNQRIKGAALGWIDRFHEGLEMELNELGLDFRFWRDKRDLEKDGFFDDKILAAVSASHVLLAVVSPVYPKRPYCLRELTHFLDQGELGDRETRVIKIVKQPLDDRSVEENLPQIIREQLGFQFYSVDRQDNKVVRFIRRDGEIASNEYWDTIYELAQTVRKHLVGSVESAPSTDVTAYLAETSSDGGASYRTIGAELKAKGVRVLPGGSLPVEHGPAVEAIDDCLAQADFSVHVLGERSGYTPEGDTAVPIVPLQLERAARQVESRPTFRRLIWAEPQVAPVEAAQKELLEGLADGRLLAPRDEFVRETLELFKNTLVDVVAGYRMPDPEIAGAAKPVFLVYDQIDAEIGSQVRNLLFDLGHEVFRPDHSGDSELERQAFDAFASQAQSAIVVFGATRESWVQQTLLRLEQWQGLGRSTPLRPKAVLLVGEPTSTKSDFRTRLADITLDATAAPLEAELERFGRNV